MQILQIIASQCSAIVPTEIFRIKQIIHKFIRKMFIIFCQFFFRFLFLFFWLVSTVWMAASERLLRANICCQKVIESLKSYQKPRQIWMHNCAHRENASEKKVRERDRVRVSGQCGIKVFAVVINFRLFRFDAEFSSAMEMNDWASDFPQTNEKQATHTLRQIVVIKLGSSEQQRQRQQWHQPKYDKIWIGKNGSERTECRVEWAAGDSSEMKLQDKRK